MNAILSSALVLGLCSLAGAHDTKADPSGHGSASTRSGPKAGINLSSEGRRQADRYDDLPDNGGEAQGRESKEEELTFSASGS